MATKIIKESGNRKPKKKRDKHKKRYHVLSNFWATEYYDTKFWAYFNYYGGRLFYWGPSRIIDTQYMELEEG